MFLNNISSFRSLQAFNKWSNDPVSTTVGTPAYPISDIEFPTFTVCGQGQSYSLVPGSNPFKLSILESTEWKEMDVPIQTSLYYLVSPLKLLLASESLCISKPASKLV